LFKLMFSGLLIGIGAIMPGVSGGALAFILGLYDKLLDAVSNFFTCTKEKRKEYFLFLCQVGLGVVTGVLIFTRVIEYLYLHYAEPTNFLFMGLIIASLPTIFKENKGKINKFGIFSLVAGAIFMLFFLQFGEPDKNLAVAINESFTSLYYAKMLFCGFVIAASLIIPGLSGTVLMLLIGEYYNVVSYINNFNIKPLLFIGIGGALGAVIFAKFLDFLFKKHKTTTIYCMLGLITASVVGIWPGFTRENAIINIVCFVSGILIMYFGEKLGNKK